MAPRTRQRTLVWVGALAVLLGPGVAAADSPAGPNGRGRPARIVLEIDTASFSLKALDTQSGAAGPSLPVAVGSPEAPTPHGEFRLGVVVFQPSWVPGKSARDAGAEPEGASLVSPMGAVKLPFAENGSIALHGGGDVRLLGKPVSSGCIRASDADLLRLVAWLHRLSVLGEPRQQASGEIHRSFTAPAILRVR